MKISILLPFKENFSPSYAGAVSLFINDTYAIMVSILFLQMPYTIYRGAHLRTAIVYQNLGDYGQRTIDFIVALLGIWFFYSIALGSWEDMIIGWEVDEREGEGSISVPIYPVRTLLFAFGVGPAVALGLFIVGKVFN